MGESAPLYLPEQNETQKAANRRIEIRLLPYRG
jgi:flagellar motor protein MotB